MQGKERVSAYLGVGREGWFRYGEVFWRREDVS